jgi:hypothetical protein
MNYPIIKHVVSRSLGVRDALYLDTNAWSSLAKGEADLVSIASWLERSNSVITISRFSIGELSKDDRLAARLADVIDALKVVFVDLGTNDLDGQKWHRISYEKIMSLKPASADAKKALIEMLQSDQIRNTMSNIRSDALLWESNIENMVKQRSKWTWSQFQDQLLTFIRSTCLTAGRKINEDGLINNKFYVGIKLSFGVAYQRYFLNRQPFRPSDYVDYLHASDMSYFKVVITERGMCNAIKEVQRRLPGLGPEEVHNLNWFEDIK